jgi:hypothetical protein
VQSLAAHAEPHALVYFGRAYHELRL